MKELFLQYGKELVALAVPVIAWALNTFFRARARLVVSTPHAFTFLINQPRIDDQGQTISPTQNAYTRSHLISNTGKITATGVELTFNWEPMCINIWPPRHYSKQAEPDGRCTITFASLAPGEYFDCELLSVNHELPNLVITRCDQCTAQAVAMYPQQHVPPWKRRVAATLLFFGLALVVYLAVVLLQILVLKTPVGL